VTNYHLKIGAQPSPITPQNASQTTKSVQYKCGIIQYFVCLKTLIPPQSRNLRHQWFKLFVSQQNCLCWLHR